MKITIGGLSGTGTSSVGKALAERLNFKFISGGNFARQLALENGMTIEQRDKYLLDNNIALDDEKIDGMQKEFARLNNDFVLESRLGWYNVPDSLKIKLTCEDNVRFSRTSKKDGNRLASVIEDFEKTKIKSLEREKLHKDRIEKMYGILDLNDDKHFDIIIDTTNLNLQEVLQKCIEFINNKRK